MAGKASPSHAWLDGRIVGWDECVVHARSQGAFWGANAFEGLRAYWNAEDQGAYIFRLAEHLRRLRQSCRSLRLPLGYSDEVIGAACEEVLRANAYVCDAHLVIVAHFGLSEDFNTLTLTDDTGLSITAVPMPRGKAYHEGVSACVSSFRRLTDDTMPPRVKSGANYYNSRLAHQEAVRNGYDTTLLLNGQGHVTEAPGACVVIAKAGGLISPPAVSGA